MTPRRVPGVILLAAALFCRPGAGAAQTPVGVASASSSWLGTSAGGARDGDRFSTSNVSYWQGASGQSNWWWQVEFPSPVDVGGIVQVLGDHRFVLRNAPRVYVWQTSPDGTNWTDLAETDMRDERHLYRVHRLHRVERARFWRLLISEIHGSAPTLREVEFLPATNARVNFPKWILAVNTTHDSSLPGHGKEFIDLARECAGWENAPAQQVWLPDLNEDFVKTEPGPLCAFLSGNFKDWCEVDRSLWSGVQSVLQNKELPLWASCGGAQALALITEYGVEHPWDCPHCRDPLLPQTPIYTHIGHTASKLCGDYSGCIFERGPHTVKRVGEDPIFSGLPAEFDVMESHCGQIEWAPKGWSIIATAGAGTLTKIQCLRMDDHLIYAAQFHIEMDGTTEVSHRIMTNFLELASKNAAALK